MTSVYKLIKNKPYIELETSLVFPNVILNFGFMWVQNAHPIRTYAGLVCPDLFFCKQLSLEVNKQAGVNISIYPGNFDPE